MGGIPEPDFEDPKEIYAFFGLASYHANLLESSFINWLTAARLGAMKTATQDDVDAQFSKSEAMTLGQLMRATRQHVEVPADLESQLSLALKARNRLAHHFFREHAHNHVHDVGHRVMIKELREFIELFQIVDKLVTPIYLQLWEKFGVGAEMIDREIRNTIRELEDRFGPIKDDG